ncbi:hypothetical protein BH10PSE2_BH10PSE2_22400 [soil metagenome]
MDDRQIIVATQGAALGRPARYAAPAEVWARVRDDYLGGLSAPACCRRHGVGLSALRDRAGREGWRRADRPWTPPVPPSAPPPGPSTAMDAVMAALGLSPDDLDRLDRTPLDPDQIDRAIQLHMTRAVIEGDVGQALRWRRLAYAIDEEQSEEDEAAEMQAMLALLKTKGK